MQDFNSTLNSDPESIRSILTSPEAQFFNRKLEAGESVLWAGRPITGRFPTRRIDYLKWAFVAALTLFIFTSLHGYDLLLGIKLPIELTLQVLGLTALPIFVTLLMMWQDIRQRQHTIFAVTNQRIILMNELSGLHSQITLDKVKGLRMRPKAAGRGSVIFAAPLSKALTEGRSSNQGKNAAPKLTKGLAWIENPEQVHALIEDLSKRAL